MHFQIRMYAVHSAKIKRYAVRNVKGKFTQLHDYGYVYNIIMLS